MDISIIGTGFIGKTLGRALTEAGNNVTFGSRDPASGDIDGIQAEVTTVGDALARSDIIILAVPGPAVGDLAVTHGPSLEGKLVVDATNTMGAGVANCRSALPSTVRYARAFNTLGGENMADPIFAEGRADMFFSGAESDRSTLETIIENVGLRPIYVGEDQELIIDNLFQLWIALAMKQGRGRRLALRLLDH